MVAAAKTVSTVQRNMGPSKGAERTTPARVLRRVRKRRTSLILRTVACVLGLGFLLGYIGLYANVTICGYSTAKLEGQIDQLTKENRTLRAEIVGYSDPARLEKVAVAAGMTPSTQSDFIIGPPDVRVAKND